MGHQLFFVEENEKRFLKLKKFVSYLKCKYELTDEEVVLWYKTRRNSMDISKEENEKHTDFKNEIENYSRKNNIIRNTTLNWLQQKEYKKKKIKKTLLKNVQKIIKLYENGKTIKYLSDKYNVTDRELIQFIYIKNKKTKSQFYKKRKQEIYELYNQGLTCTQIKDKLKMKYATVYAIITDKYEKRAKYKETDNQFLQNIVKLLNKKMSVKNACTQLGYTDKYTDRSIFYLLRTNTIKNSAGKFIIIKK